MTADRIRFTRTGGFANVRLTTVVDDPDEVQRIHELLGALPEGVSADRMRDGFVYEFQTEAADAAEALPVSAVREAEVPDGSRALIRTLVARSRPTPS